MASQGRQKVFSTALRSLAHDAKPTSVFTQVRTIVNRTVFAQWVGLVDKS